MNKFKPIEYNGILPKISDKALIAPNAIISGDVEIGENSGIWYNCVIRGDVAPIKIGKNTNIQDGSIVHVSRANHVQNKTGNQKASTIIGDYVTVGHMAMLHACIVEDYAFIGMSTTILDLATVETEAMVAAGSIVTPGKTVKRGEIWAGNPAKFFRKMSEAEIQYIAKSADNYLKLAKEYFN